MVVDVRRSSPTFGRWEGVTLDDDAHHQLYVPAGFAHGFCVLSELADVVYLQDDYYDPDRQLGITYLDPEVGIEWPSAARADGQRPRPRRAAAQRAVARRPSRLSAPRFSAAWSA